MPTAGKLAGAVFFAILAAAVAYLVVPLFENAKAPRYWYPLCVVTGICVGWMLVGARTGQGTGPAVGTALTGAAAIAFWVLFFLSGSDMIQSAMRGRFDGPMDAIIGVFAYMVDYAKQFATPETLGTLLGGGVVAGLLTDAIGKRYR